MTKREQETLLQTIQARLEMNEKGCAAFIPDENKSMVQKYFTSNIQRGFDKYGNPEITIPS